MYIISFDIGIRNLAYCYTFNNEILAWDVFDIKCDNVVDTCEKCMKVLHENFDNKTINKVLIENQPVQKNPTMKTIQIVVFSYFMYCKAVKNTIDTIHFVSANNKNKLAQKFNIEVTGSSKYIRAKKLSILVTKQLVNNTSWNSHFDSHKKKDDLADSYLQLLSHNNYEPVLPNPPTPLSEEDSSSTSST